jgi:putative ABC transport system permease protein
MNLAWKEIKKSKLRFSILASIVFLIELLTFIIAGLANGLADDNASLIKNLPDGTFYLSDDADQTYNLSAIEKQSENKIVDELDGATAFSIQMGFVYDENEKQKSVAFVTSTSSNYFEQVNPGEVVLNSSLKDEGINIGDKLTNNQLDGELTVTGFVDQEKFSHAPAAFINKQDYKSIYGTDKQQMILVPDKEARNVSGLESFSKNELLQSISSYKAEQMTLDMIVWFLIIISGMLFAIFFYMMIVQKIGMYGILKAMGLKTTVLLRMIWSQMLFLSVAAIVLAVACTTLFSFLAPDGMPFSLDFVMLLWLSLIFIIVGFAGATISAVQIKKAEPLQAIQQGDI